MHKLVTVCVLIGRIIFRFTDYNSKYLGVQTERSPINRTCWARRNLDVMCECWTSINSVEMFPTREPAKAQLQLDRDVLVNKSRCLNVMFCGYTSTVRLAAGTLCLADIMSADEVEVWSISATYEYTSDLIRGSICYTQLSSSTLTTRKVRQQRKPDYPGWVHWLWPSLFCLTWLWSVRAWDHSSNSKSNRLIFITTNTDLRRK